MKAVVHRDMCNQRKIKTANTIKLTSDPSGVLHSLQNLNTFFYPFLR